MPEIFESDAFIDYSHKLSVHMAEQEHRHDMRVNIILPSVLGKFDDQFKATKQLLIEVTKGSAENIVLKNEVNTLVTDSIKNLLYGKDNEAMMDIDQELVLVLPGTTLNEHVGGTSEDTVTSECTIPVKFNSVQCLVDH